MEKKVNLLFLLILAVLTVLCAWPLMHNGFFPMHDNTQVARVFEMYQSLVSGMFPVRWVMDLGYGYGYPIFNFYAPFSYYLGGGLMFLGINALDATKLMIFGSLLCSAWWMYLLGKELWGERGGVVASVMYLLAPYHAVNLYVRGAVAELWGMAFIPLVFYCLLKIRNGYGLKYAFLGSVAFALLILSHNLTAMMVTPFALFISGLIIFFASKRKKLAALVFIFLSLGIILSCFYFLPALSEMKYTDVASQISGSGSKYSDHFLCPTQLWNSPWGYAGSTVGCVDGMSFRLGKLHILLALLSVVLLPLFYKKSRSKAIIVILCAVLSLFSLALTLALSKPLWDLLKPMAYLQFPWRFLGVASLFISLLAGGSIWLIEQGESKKYYSYIAVVLIMLGSSFFYLKHFKPERFTSDTAQSLTQISYLRFEVSKISDEYMPPKFLRPQKTSDQVSERILILKGQGKIDKIKDEPGALEYKLQSSQGMSLLIKLAPFPAWKAYLDGKEMHLISTSKGIRLNLPPGEHKLSLLFVQTFIESLSNIVSLVGLLILILGIIYLTKKKHYEQKKP